ncbi:hypothetical protein HNP86_001600 [Methanococcus maripaludis]|uniref:PEGA domain-containing protein n=1 Tax=Methanococcus maripaludis TaxID=39152 RepID=A0A7J9NVU8_METMI|nr:hypothetical protein [Methanococcus maripaludis]MBA2851447.1 hypothetical protein [Methanococcus maripaludis]
MKKTSFFLFLLLIGCIGSVSATVDIVLPTDCIETDYIVGIDYSNSTEIYDILSETPAWVNSYPVISGIANAGNGGEVYFESEDDMVRFLLPRTGSYPLLFDTALMSTVADNRVYYASKTSGSTTYQMVATKDCWVYYFGRAVGNLNSDTGRLYLYKDDMVVSNLVAHYGVTSDYFNRIYAPEGTVFNVTMSFSNSYTTFYFAMACNDGDLEVLSDSPSTPSTILFDSYQFSFDVYGEPSMSVYEDGELVGVTDSLGYLCIYTELGTHDYNFTKDGYWDESETVTITGSGQNVSVEMFPEDELYLVSTNIVTQNIVPNEVVSATITIEPKYLSKDTKIHFSKELESVKIGVSDVSMYGEDYILGDISEPTTITVTFNSGTLTGNRYIEYQVSGTTWVNAETLTFQKLGNIDYFVNELPIIVYMPTWEIGENEFRITEQEGNTLSLNVEVLDSEENSIYEQNKVFNPYGVERFTVNLSESGSYILRIYCSEYDILLPFTVGTVTIEDDTEDDTIPPIVDDSEGIFDMILNYWYFPVGLVGIVGISKLFFGKKGRKDRKKTNKGGNKK